MHTYSRISCSSSWLSTSVWSKPSRILMSSRIWVIRASSRSEGWPWSTRGHTLRYVIFFPKGPIVLYCALLYRKLTVSLLHSFRVFKNLLTRERCCWLKGLLPARSGSNAVRVLAGSPKVLRTAFRHSISSVLASALPSNHDWHPYHAVQ